MQPSPLAWAAAYGHTAAMGALVLEVASAQAASSERAEEVKASRLHAIPVQELRARRGRDDRLPLCAADALPPAPELGCRERLCSWEERITLGPEGKQVRPRTLGLLSAATVVAGALAGFIGFGNGLLFATMLIVGLEHSTQGGTATACASTSVLMTAVFLVYCHHLRKEILGYIAVGVASSTVGAAAGPAFAAQLGSAPPPGATATTSAGSECFL